MSYFTDPISNSDNTIDTRDIEKRIDALKSDEADLENEIEEAVDAGDAEAERLARAELESWRQGDDGEELELLQSLKEDIEGYCPDWHHGATLINESYIEEYAQELAEDLGAIDRNAGWPLGHIDWKAAADELFSNDYTQVDFDGVTFYVR